jgi:hypothetical protein
LKLFDIFSRLKRLYPDSLPLIRNRCLFLVFLTVIDALFLVALGWTIEKLISDRSAFIFGYSAIDVLILLSVLRAGASMLTLQVQRSIFTISAHSISLAQFSILVFGERRNSVDADEMRRLLLVEPAFFTNRGIRPFINLLVEMVIFVCAFLYFFVMSSSITMVIGLTVFTTALFILVSMKKILGILSHRRQRYERERQKYVSRVLAMRERLFCFGVTQIDRVSDRMSKMFLNVSKVSADLLAVALIPRIVVEFSAVLFVVMVFLSDYDFMSADEGGLGGLITLIVRLMSGSGRVVVALQSIKLGLASMNAMVPIEGQR